VGLDGAVLSIAYSSSAIQEYVAVRNLGRCSLRYVVEHFSREENRGISRSPAGGSSPLEDRSVGRLKRGVVPSIHVPFRNSLPCGGFHSAPRAMAAATRTSSNGSQGSSGVDDNEEAVEVMKINARAALGAKRAVNLIGGFSRVNATDIETNGGSL
jgi:hypothetical protein